jgi:hypothetical protein
MIRSFAVAIVLSCFAPSAWAQTQPAPEAPAAKPAVKKTTPKAKAAAKSSGPAENGTCDLGVITAAGSPIGWRKIGITVFGNETAETASDAWGIDDLSFARIKAVAGSGILIRRISYAKDAFDPYYKPEKKLSGDSSENFKIMIRGIIGNNRCARYLVVTRYTGVLPGTNQPLSGVGVLTQGPFGKAAVFAFTRMFLLDGETLESKDPFGGVGARWAAALSSIGRDDYIRAANTEFPASPEEAVKKPILRDAARALVAERMDRILPKYLAP